MAKFTRRCGLTALLVAGLLGPASTVRAQFNFNPNMNPSVVSGLNQAQFMALLQQAAAARAAAQSQGLFPGLNPVNPYTPVGTNPYAPGMINPYNPAGAPFVSPYDQPYANPYLPYADPGSVLRGQADVMRAYGTVITSQEQARIVRELAMQAKLETRKKK